MSVSTKHSEYIKYQQQWERCRDVIDGSDAVKGKREKYLPRLKAQNKSDYDAYIKRALFFSITGRSLQGLVGTMTRRTPTIDEKELSAFFKDVSLTSKSFYELFVESCNEVLSVGRYGYLIDMPEDGGRSYIATYTSEDIINWKFNGDRLEFVVLKEEIFDSESDDMFDLTKSIQYRVLRLRSGEYVQDIYNEKEELTRTITPTIKGKAMDFIPFVCVNTTGVSISPCKPPLLDIVDVNLSQYISSADLENGRHFTALPQPVITGADADKPLRVGGTEAWVIPNAAAKVYYLEFQGSGLQSLENAIKEKTGHMAQFSSRLMDTTTRGSEAADTVRLRYAADSATLNSIAIALESAFTLVFKYVSMIESTDQPEIELNKDFLDTKLSSTELRELTNSYLNGGIDLETYIYNLSRGEMLPPGKQTFNNPPSNSDNT